MQSSFTQAYSSFYVAKSWVWAKVRRLYDTFSMHLENKLCLNYFKLRSCYFYFKMISAILTQYPLPLLKDFPQPQEDGSLGEDFK